MTLRTALRQVRISFVASVAILCIAAMVAPFAHASAADSGPGPCPAQACPIDDGLAVTGPDASVAAPASSSAEPQEITDSPEDLGHGSATLESGAAPVAGAIDETAPASQQATLVDEQHPIGTAWSDEPRETGTAGAGVGGEAGSNPAGSPGGGELPFTGVSSRTLGLISALGLALTVAGLALVGSARRASRRVDVA